MSDTTVNPVQAVYMITYDVPKKGTAKNPARLFRRLGVWINGSSWMMTEGAVPHAHLQSMRTATPPCKVTMIRFDRDEAATMVAVARESVRERLKEALQSLEASEASAQLAFEENANARAFRNRVRGAVNAARRKIADYEEAARTFNLNPDQLGFFGARDFVEVVNASAVKKAEEYLKAGELLAQAGEQGLSDGVKHDDAPALVVADALEERGLDASNLRAAFNGHTSYDMSDVASGLTLARSVGDSEPEVEPEPAALPLGSGFTTVATVTLE